MSFNNPSGLSRPSAILLGVCFVLAGSYHLFDPEFYLPMMPSYLPWHRELILLSGFAEIVLGVMSAFAMSRRFARFGLLALLFAVFPANVEMVLHQEKFPGASALLLWLRLPFQGVLILWVLRALSEPPTSESASLRSL